MDGFNGSGGIGNIHALAKDMAAATEVVEVPNGEHTVPQAKYLKQIGQTQQQVNELVRDAIVGFVASLSSAGPSGAQAS